MESQFFKVITDTLKIDSKSIKLNFNTILMYSMISVVLRIYGGSSCVFIFNLMELTFCLDLPHVDRYAPLKYFWSSSMFCGTNGTQSWC